jgi:hypothetical protein
VPKRHPHPSRPSSEIDSIRGAQRVLIKSIEHGHSVEDATLHEAFQHVGMID